MTQRWEKIYKYKSVRKEHLASKVEKSAQIQTKIQIQIRIQEITWTEMWERVRSGSKPEEWGLVQLVVETGVRGAIAILPPKLDPLSAAPTTPSRQCVWGRGLRQWRYENITLQSAQVCAWRCFHNLTKTSWKITGWSYPLSCICVILRCVEVIRCLEEGRLLLLREELVTLSLVSQPTLLASSRKIADVKKMAHFLGMIFIVWPHWGGCRLCIWLHQIASLLVWF